MHSYLWIVLLVLFTDMSISYAQQTDPPQPLHNLSQERLKTKFKLSKQKYEERIDFTKIDTNAIYIRQQKYSYNSTDTAYVFLRFFKDGVFESGAYLNPPTTEEAEDLTYGSWRCYTFHNKTGMLVIEVPMPFMMSSRWMYYLGLPSEDSLKITGTCGKYPGKDTTLFQVNYNYYKQPVTFKNRAHVWMPATKEDL